MGMYYNIKIKNDVNAENNEIKLIKYIYIDFFDDKKGHYNCAIAVPKELEDKLNLIEQLISALEPGLNTILAMWHKENK